MKSPRSPDAAPDVGREVEREVESLGDPETASPFPAAALAAHAAAAASAREDRRARRRRTDREIWTLAWPVILSQALASFVSLADIAMVGRLSREAVAAVGYATQYLWLVQSALFAVGIACVAMMARAIGARRIERARGAHAASLVVGIAVGLATSAIAIAVPGALLSGLGAEPAVAALGAPYMRLTFASMPLFSAAIVIESALRADRDTRTPMRIALAVTSMKLALNAVLIFGALGFPRLELAGAGLATVASQVVAVALFAWASRSRGRGSAVRLGRRDLAAARPLLGEVARLSAPAIGERLVMNGAMMAYFALIGGYGTAALAAYTIGIRVLSFTWIPGIGFSTAASTLVGQALGARDGDGAARAGWRAVRMALLVSVALGGFFAVARVPVARLFTSDAGVVGELGPFMLVLALSQPLMGLHFTLGGALRGAGDTVTPLVAATLGNWLFRVPLAFLVSVVLRADVIWLWCTLALDHLARALWLLWAFQRGAWQDAGRDP
jgi:putative MATE family efflux protein